jgi:hypothetical protein
VVQIHPQAPSFGEVNMPFAYDKNATPDPTCKACKQEWPIHVDKETGKRMHIDVIGFHKDYGFSADCPTQNWPDDEDEDETIILEGKEG